MRLSLTAILAAGALTFASTTVSRNAEACGGTFCDSGPRAMPVNQTGENILFVVEAGMVEAHIQIQYKGEAAKFSWILPVQKHPEVTVGAEAMFTQLLQSTVPTFSFQRVFDDCGAVASSTGSSSFSAATGAGTGGSTGTGTGGPPLVVEQKTVGAFQTAILSGGTTAEVIQWLTDNMYQVPPMASTLLDGYVAKMYEFVAVKLQGGKGLDSIHPLVVRFAGTEPCVPLKLTAIATEDDMGVRAFFLGNQRVIPTNYKHVIPNLAKLDWFNAITGYNELISRAVDSPIANGKAFVTEYAGPTAIVSAAPLASSLWNAVPFVTAKATEVMQLLQNQGLASCNGGQCAFLHPLVLPLLRTYLPPPAMLNVNGNVLVDPTLIEAVFYNCLTCYMTQIDMTKWSGPGFAQDLSKQIIEPAKHADTLLSTWPYLTRLYTTMSAAEMDVDPEFAARPGLPTVPRINLTATLRTTCESKTGMILPGGRNVALPNGNSWPRFPTTMPWAESIEEIKLTGDPVVLVDNNVAIDAELKGWNDSQAWTPRPSGTSSSSTGFTSTTSSGTPSSAVTGGTGGASGTSGAGGSNNAAPEPASSGCGCRTVASPPAGGLSWAALGLLGLARLRRRRQPS